MASETASEYEIVSQAYPGLREGDKKIDWTGAGFDHRSIVDTAELKEYSELWKEALLKTC